MCVLQFDFDIVAVSVLIPNDFYQLKRFAAVFWPVVTQKRKNKEIVSGLVIYNTYSLSCLSYSPEFFRSSNCRWLGGLRENANTTVCEHSYYCNG